MRVGDLLPYKYNPKTHPASQMTRIEAVLEKFGKVQGVIAWYSQRNGGELTTFDGNARRNLDPDETWLVNVTDLDDAEVDELVFYFDPLAGMSLHDEAKMTALMQDLGDVDGVLGEMLEELQGVVPEVDYSELWRGMPEFEQEDLGPYRTIYVHFATEEDIEKFARLVQQTITDRTKFIWYPKVEVRTFMDKQYIDES